MITGYCLQGSDGPGNPALHAKCTQPSRCTCSCHTGAIPTSPPAEETPMFACDQCDRTFDTAQGRSMHITRSHKQGGWSNRKKNEQGDTLPPIKVPVAPEPDVDEDQADGHMSNALYAITGWYGGLYIDLTVDTGTELVDPNVLRAVIALAAALAE